ncbi:MAG: hypothetical protein JXB07_18790 [Anaerolineae bacterium]|nr:hypothetical protein [Anaerolineae bacterium]
MNRDTYSMLGTLARGYEVKIRLNRRWFVLVQDGSAIMASTNGEQHRFIGCTDIKVRPYLNLFMDGKCRSFGS